jgi:hypothetical protein
MQQTQQPTRAPRVGFRVYRKIDIYLKRPGGMLDYLCSTNAARTLREARESYAAGYGAAASDLVAYYAKH